MKIEKKFTADVYCGETLRGCYVFQKEDAPRGTILFSEVEKNRRLDQTAWLKADRAMMRAAEEVLAGVDVKQEEAPSV